MEHPVGVGYSYSSDPKPISDSTTAAVDFSAFLSSILTKKFRKGGKDITLIGRPLHIAGESYAGHYIPAIASRLIKDTKITYLNLKSIWIGSAAIDKEETGKGLYELLCSPSPEAPLLKVTDDLVLLKNSCSFQATQISVCSAAIMKCRASSDLDRETNCELVGKECEVIAGGSWGKKFNKNPYFVTQPVSANDKEEAYYNTAMKKFLNNPVQKAQFGVDKVPKPITWNWENDDIFNNFDISGDRWRSYTTEVEEILNAGIDLMLYVVSKVLEYVRELTDDSAGRQRHHGTLYCCQICREEDQLE